MRAGTTIRATIGCCVTLAALAIPPATSTAEQPGADLPADLVAAIERDLRLTPQQYLERADRSRRLADFALFARIAYPSVFAGVHMDDDRAVVSLADGPSTADARQVARQAGFDVAMVADSEAVLRDRHAAFERWLATQPDSVVDNIRSYGINVAHNALAVHQVRDAQLPRDLGPIRSVAAAGPKTGPDTNPPGPGVLATTPDSPYIGGTPYGVAYGDSTPRCTLGFNGTDGAGRAVNITAGHCNPGNWFDPAARAQGTHRIYDMQGGQRGAAIGEFETSQLGPHDYAVVRILDEYAPRFRNNLVSVQEIDAPHPVPSGSGGSAALPPAGSSEVRSGSGGPAGLVPVAMTADKTLEIEGTAEPVDGADVCKMGIITGFACGKVTGVGQNMITKGVPGDAERGIAIAGMFTTNICTHRGDSGGPVFTLTEKGAQALGMTSSGSPDTDQPAPTCGPHPLHVVQPITTVLQQNKGLSIRTE
ncbi:S1 family peptidase [Nocardia wallacei]|uniref:S1 family peptidase n=1 Tax=Nocardia wallacei TaxID=480035 RepID=UPI0024565CAD|nr:S1 family peptidase [Nocardia wallacei]